MTAVESGDAAVGSLPVLTLSATYGAGGSVVAPRLAERLGLPFADRLIPATDGPSPGPGVERITDEELRQRSRSSFLTRLASITGGLGLPVPLPEDLADPVRERVEHSIEVLTQTTGAVILGRAAAVVLAGHPRAFHVRLDGPLPRRAARAMTIEGVDERTSRRRLEDTDRARSQYVERLYNIDPADPRLYHLIVDSTVLSLEATVEVVTTAALAFWEYGKPPKAAP
jgi:cytidylate kinase